MLIENKKIRFCSHNKVYLNNSNDVPSWSFPSSCWKISIFCFVIQRLPDKNVFWNMHYIHDWFDAAATVVVISMWYLGSTYFSKINKGCIFRQIKNHKKIKHTIYIGVVKEREREWEREHSNIFADKKCAVHT